MIEKLKQNSPVIFLGFISIIALNFELLAQTNSDEEFIIYFIVLLYLLVSYISWLNIFSIRKKENIIYFIDIGIQIIIFIQVNICDILSPKINKMQLIIFVLINLLIGLQLAIRICIPISEKNSTEGTNKLGQEEVVQYLTDSLLGLFRRENICIDQYKNKRIKISVLNSLAFMVFILSYALKFVVDLLNIGSEHYYFPAFIVNVYIIFLTLFILIESMKNKLLSYSIFKNLFIILTCAFGIYFFVFKQFGNINFRIILCMAYLIGPYILDTWKVVQKYFLDNQIKF